MGLLGKKTICNGLTLIELLISLSIIGIMTTIAIPQFSRYQRRASLGDDVESLVQLINYARTLHNNPTYQRYSLPTTSAYFVQISQNDDIYSVDLFSQTEPNLAIDSVKFSNYEEVIAPVSLFSLAGESPKESLRGCNAIGSDADNCPKPLDIRVKVKNSSLEKIVRIHHTTEPFSVEVINQ